VILAICVPFLNERDYLPPFLESLAAQTRQPDRLLLVDDGSSDGSHDVAASFASSHPWATLLRRPPRDSERDRLATAKELEAFQWAVDQLDVEWDVIAKLDADLRLTPRTIETLLTELERDERLGLAGSYLQEAGQRIRIGEGHVHGATKFFRRACFEEISPVPPILGWDTIDEFTARMRGWRTQSFAMPDGDPEHLRPRGTYDGLLRGYRRWGECSYALGESPLHVGLYTLRQMATERPRVTGGASYAAGYAGAALRRVPRAEPDVRAAVRREQKQKIKGRILRIP
jgi:glycosyltransferase involved in cell wall biosynthesis